MKINGKEVKGPNKVTLVLPREDEDDIVIIAEAVSDLDEVDEILIAPKPPVKLMKGNTSYKDVKNPEYLQQLEDYNLKKLAYLVIKSLVPSNIEWSVVDLDNPGTWLKYQDEFKEAGFSQVEINRIGNAAMQANCLDESALDAAREVFLRGQQDQ